MVWKNPDDTICKWQKYYTNWYSGENSIKNEIIKNICTVWK